MTTNRYPVLLWRDHSGSFTAAIVGDFDNAVACAETETAALKQLKELLQWRNEHTPLFAAPDIENPVYFEVKVEIRCEYKRKPENRPIPVPDPVWLRVPCVSGVDDCGMNICCLPHLGFTFTYQESESLKPLVAHYVKDELRGLNPLQLFHKLPPHGCELREIVVRAAGGKAPVIPPMNRPELKVLFRVADPLVRTERSTGGAAAYGRDAVIETLVQKLAVEKANVLLVGDTGAGKTTILKEAAKRITRADATADSIDRDLREFRFWRTSGGRLIGGMAYLGEWEERCETVIERLNTLEGVLCGENLLEMLQVGGQGPGNSVAAFLLPYLRRGELRLAAEATNAELEACRRLLPSLLDVFQIVHVPAFEEKEAIDVLRKIASGAAAGRKAVYEPALPLVVHHLFSRFQPSNAFPGAAARFTRALFEAKQQSSVSTQEAIESFTRQTGLPEAFLRDDLPMRAEEIRQALSRKIIGQPAAIDVATRVITTIKAGLTDANRPFGVLLFTGPTGVGKTALAKAMADFCFGSGAEKDRLIRLDMSEYGGWGAVHRFLSGPENRPARWIEKVRAQPFSVVLFDEIEKAEADVFDALLGLLDEGRLTDPFGRLTNFRSAIIVMTSNLGSGARSVAGFGGSTNPSFQEEVARFFRPEFFNRLDAVVDFNALTLPDIEQIARKELLELANREGLTAAGIKLRWTEELVAHLAREGCDQRLGARPLQRVIERLVATPLSRWKVNHPGQRDRTLVLSIDSNRRITLSEE